MGDPRATDNRDPRRAERRDEIDAARRLADAVVIKGRAFAVVFLALTSVLVLRDTSWGVIVALLLATTACLAAKPILTVLFLGANAVARLFGRFRQAHFVAFSMWFVVAMTLTLLFPRSIDGIYAGQDPTPAAPASRSRQLARLKILDVETSGDRFRISGVIEVAKGPCSTDRDVTVRAAGSDEAIDNQDDAAHGFTLSGPLPPDGLVVVAEPVIVTVRDATAACAPDAAVVPRSQLRPGDASRTPRIPDSGRVRPEQPVEGTQPPEPARPEGEPVTPAPPAPPDPEPAKPDPE